MIRSAWSGSREVRTEPGVVDEDLANRPSTRATRAPPAPPVVSTIARHVGSPTDHRTSAWSWSRLPTHRNSVARLTPSSSARACMSMRCPARNRRRSQVEGISWSGRRPLASELAGQWRVGDGRPPGHVGDHTRCSAICLALGNVP